MYFRNKLFFMVTLGFCASLLAANSWNAADDFSLAGNPNGQWTYGYALRYTNLAPPYLLFNMDCPSSVTFGEMNGFVSWNKSTDPTLGCNPLPVDIAASWGGYWTAHTCSAHPGANGEYAIYRWTAPESGKYKITAVFFVGHLTQTDTDIHIIKNGSASGGSHLFDSDINAKTRGNNDSKSYSLSLNLNAGDTIDFAVGRGADGSYASDTTLLNATIKKDTSCVSSIQWDFNSDCYVNFLDLDYIAQNWLNQYDLVDFSSLALSWQQCIDPCNTNCRRYIEMQTARNWINKSFKNSQPRLPVSFKYNGLYSNNFLSGWPLASSSQVMDANRVQHTLVYTEPSVGNLKVTAIATEYLDYPAVEWVVWFENIGTSNTSIIENILPLDASIISNGAGAYQLRSARGSFQTGSQAPSPPLGTPMDFEPLTYSLNQTIPATQIALGPISGRSSDGGNNLGTGRMPFFNLDQTNSGIIWGIGWTGQWNASFEQLPGNMVNLSAGMELTHLKLYPGEKIRTPSILAMFWYGSYIQSQNTFRELVMDHYTPRPGGKPPVMPIASSPHGTPGMDFVNVNETNMLAFIDRTHQHNLPVDTIWLDAGWYNLNGHNDANYINWVYVGTWDPDPIRFPNGLKPVIDRAHLYGYKFLLWCEPERVSQGSWLANNHPEWIIKEPNETAFRWLLNFGDPNVLAWAKAKFSNLITDANVDIYRHDFNMNTTLLMWRARDAADRQGMTEIKYIMGLYEFFDYLQQQHPDLLIDNCASGGRRLDLEMFKRSVCLSRSDWWWEPVGEQVMQYGLSYWYPWHGVGSNNTNSYIWRSGMGSCFATALNSLDLTTWTPATTLLNQYKQIQNTYLGEFYPLTDCSLADNVWIAWQNNLPEGKGSVELFRRANCSSSSFTLKFQGLDPNATYTVTNIDGGSWNRSGSSLMTNGLPISVFTQPGSVVLKYTRN